jgi:hypothetical protein
MSVGSNRIPRRHAAAPSRIIDGAAVVIHTREAEVSMLNEVGTLIWSAIDGTRSEADLAKLVAERFEVATDAAAGDVSSFLDELAAASLVEFGGAR